MQETLNLPLDASNCFDGDVIELSVTNTNLLLNRIKEEFQRDSDISLLIFQKQMY